MRHRYDILTRITAMDPVRDHLAVHRLTATHEFPWDMNQALSFALFRTYAVPSIGELLARTGEFTERVQKRYDDTGLILDAVLEHGPDSATGKAAIRRMNQMHRSYEISDDDMRYVLCTFVITPIRWMDAYAWRPMSGVEKIASAEYYKALGTRMGIKGIPDTWQEFARVHDAYEADHFAFSEGGRAVADATLALLGTFPPHDKLPAAVVRQTSFALMDDALLAAFRYPQPNPVLAATTRAGLRARGRALRFAAPRTEPFYARQLPTIRSYPDGYDVSALGTFPTGCPVPH
ncbi:oxygenase MpaB family protein [Klenkia marina]|uniref:oxygenase MpaB family protein n=1 Tax=Klenkia marina TaxID=1960309 RepID=UPI00140402F6|nr:oxygenase MpaB family protein [Klenkia marina]